MDATTIIGILRAAVPDVAFEAGQALDQPAIDVPREHLVETARVLRDHPDLQFAFLADVTASDWWPREPRFEIVYLLACLGVSIGHGRPVSVPKRLRLKVRVPGGDARVPTVSAVWPAANWSEREVYDLFGVVFDGHPDLRRIMMPDDWEGHPLRKDYPVQVTLAVKTQHPLQLTEEEFLANIEAARHGATPPSAETDVDRPSSESRLAEPGTRPADGTRYGRKVEP